ncbi:MAG: alcohol dehydrogenase catalytic domain-containing protein [Rhizomicrobium sp.]
MRAYEIAHGAKGLSGLTLVERADPVPGPRQVLVRIRAASLNFRDLAVVQGVYPGPPAAKPVIPLSDGAGEVLAVGEGVTRFKPGDRVAPTFFQVWIEGKPRPSRALGAAPVDGVLAENDRPARGRARRAAVLDELRGGRVARLRRGHGVARPHGRRQSDPAGRQRAGAGHGRRLDVRAAIRPRRRRPRHRDPRRTTRSSSAPRRTAPPTSSITRRIPTGTRK